MGVGARVVRAQQWVARVGRVHSGRGVQRRATVLDPDRDRSLREDDRRPVGGVDTATGQQRHLRDEVADPAGNVVRGVAWHIRPHLGRIPRRGLLGDRRAKTGRKDLRDRELRISSSRVRNGRTVVGGAILRWPHLRRAGVVVSDTAVHGVLPNVLRAVPHDVGAALLCGAVSA